NWTGYCYENGYGVEKNYTQAVYYYNKAIDLGNIKAMSNLGACYYHGYGTEKDYTKAVTYYNKAIDLGNINAMLQLGICYYYGHGVKQDYKQAFSWFKKAADKNHANACNWTGYCYENGYGVEKNYTQAVSYYNKAIDLGNIDAMSNLGACYYHGYGVKKDYRIAFSWFKKAADKNHAGACNWMGDCYENGYGVNKNLDFAIKWYKKAKQNGYDAKKCDKKINEIIKKKNNFLEPYEGHDPYIFISYCHKNQDMVKDILNNLSRLGYRFWYDKGINVGSSWNDNIASHIDNASHFIFFLSNDFIQSKYCLDELEYAKSEDKQIIPVCIEETKISGGLKLSINRLQVFNKYQFSESYFYDQIAQIQNIHKCNKNTE
ncbi:TIR domain-containing protein, partial [Catenibacterium mitsuokai]